jgi:hypothetical protein
MNDVDFKYVVLRNWENLPHNVETGIHSDLDLLVYDLDHFLEIFPMLEPAYPLPRVRYKLTFDDGQFIYLDARHLGDSYYPDEFEENILKTREWNKAGFWTPNPLHHRIALAYHVVHHKNANTYPKYLCKTEKDNELAPMSVGELLEALKGNKELAWVEPDDPSVGRFNSYQVGGTSVVSDGGDFIEKKQVRYKKYSLIDNEERILGKLHSIHFPKVLSRDGDTLRIEHCGEPIKPDNLPKDWKLQLELILHLLEKSGIVHRDIRMDNLMVSKGIIKLVDFGWARLAEEADGKHPDLLGYPNKCPMGFNDRYSMNRVIKQIEEEMDDAHIGV